MLSRQPSPRGGDLQLCSNRPLNDIHCASKVALPAQRSAGGQRICRWPRMPRRGGNWGLSRRDAAPPDRGGRCPAEPGARPSEPGEPGVPTDSIRWPIPGLHT